MFHYSMLILLITTQIMKLLPSSLLPRLIHKPRTSYDHPFWGTPYIATKGSRINPITQPRWIFPWFLRDRVEGRARSRRGDRNHRGGCRLVAFSFHSRGRCTVSTRRVSAPNNRGWYLPCPDEIVSGNIALVKDSPGLVEIAPFNPSSDVFGAMQSPYRSIERRYILVPLMDPYRLNICKSSTAVFCWEASGSCCNRQVTKGLLFCLTGCLRD